LPTRTILKDREAKPLLEALRHIAGGSLSHKSRVELESVKDAQVVFVDGEPVAMKKSGEFFPVLVDTAAMERLPKVVVDMGAVPHVVGGADVMAPGIRRVQGEFPSGQLLVVVDEKHGKYLALGRSLVDSTTLSSLKKGKAVLNLHYVGDPVWEAIKSFLRAPAGAAG
jgi:PUA domain protein